MRPVGTFHNTAISKACHCFRYCQECVKFKIVCSIRNSVAHHPLKCRIFNELYTSWANFRWKLPLLGGIFLIAVRYFRLHLLAFFASFAFSSFVELFQAKPQARADTHTHTSRKARLYAREIIHLRMWASNQNLVERRFSPSDTTRFVWAKCEKLIRWLLYRSWRFFPRLLWHVCPFYWGI